MIKAAAVFVREAGIEAPPRLALDAFITEWMEANVPKDLFDPSGGAAA